MHIIFFDGHDSGIQSDRVDRQRCGKLLWNLRHPQRGNRSIATSEITHHELEFPNPLIELILQKHTAEKRPEKSLDHRFGKTFRTQGLKRCQTGVVV